MKNKINFVKILLLGHAFVLLFCSSAFSQGQDMPKMPIRIVQKDQKYILTMPDSLLERDFLVQNLIAKGPVAKPKGFTKDLYRGLYANESIIRFSRGPGRKILMTEAIDLKRSEDSHKDIYKSLATANQQAVLESFQNISDSKDSLFAIDVTNLIMSDYGIYSLAPSIYSNLYKLGSMQKDKSYLKKIELHERGLDMLSFRTYFAGSQCISFELNCSLLLLAKKPMNVRYTDDRVTASSFTTISYTDFDKNNQTAEISRIQRRHKIEPKREEIDKYLRGELVEPQKPIVVYIDPTTPPHFLPYFIEGINNWQIAFEAAGFKNAIQAKVVNPNDTLFNILSARYNRIFYIPSDVYGAQGSHVFDPRSGEIINMYVRVNHSYAKHFRNEYMIQAGAIDTGARKAILSNELIGKCYTSVISHEVGHALGIHHSYMSSANVPVMNLRNKLWVEKHGISPSIMDYSRYNYVAQPEDQIGREGIISKIGDYDKWVIEWLYRWFPDNDAVSDRKKLDDLTEKRLKENPLLHYLPFEYDAEDVRLGTEDIGDDPILAGEYGIKNLKFIVPHLLEWTKDTTGEYNYEAAKELYEEAWKQYQRYVDRVQNLVWGNMIEFNSINSKKRLKFVSKSTQKRAVDFLINQLFKAPTWLFDKQLLYKMQLESNGYLLRSQTVVLRMLFDSVRLEKVVYTEAINPDFYSIDEMLTDLENGIFYNLDKSKQIDINKRNLQTQYLECVILLIEDKGLRGDRTPKLSDAGLIGKAHLRKLKSFIDQKILTYSNSITKLHLEDMSEKIEMALKVGIKRS